MPFLMIRNDNPKKKTVPAFAVGLHLSEDETADLHVETCQETVPEAIIFFQYNGWSKKSKGLFAYRE